MRDKETPVEAYGASKSSLHTAMEAELFLAEHGFSATSAEHYLPELHALLDLRWEIMRRTALNVVEKIVSPVPGSRMMIGVTHRPFLESVPVALIDLGIEHALVYGAIEGSDEASVDSSSSLVRLRNGETEEFRTSPESVGLSRATRTYLGKARKTRPTALSPSSKERPVRLET